MKHYTRTTASGSMIALALMLFLTACGGKQTVASKSAAAFREAQKKGTTIGGDSHGGHSAGGDDHGAMTSSAGDHSTMAGMDHSTMTGMDHSTMTAGTQDSMAGMDHSKMNMGGQSNSAAMDRSKMQHDHSNMQHGQSMTGMAGMQHGSTPKGQQPMAGMDHGSMPGMQHGAGAAGSAVRSAPTSSAEIQQLRPEATLRADDFDAPAPISVTEARKAQGGREMSGIAPAAAMDHSQHGQTAPATPPRTQSRATATATPAQDKPVAATVYTCPMHPEVTSDKPGTCPKCGMTLVKKN